MNFKDYLNDLMKKNSDFYIEDNELSYIDVQCTNDIEFLLENEEEIEKTDFINQLSKAIMDMYIKDLDWFLTQITDVNDIRSISDYANDIVNVLEIVKSY